MCLLVSKVRDLLQILEGHVDLSFHLQQQQLIELIRENKIEEALDFAEAFLAPIGEENPELLKELGKPPFLGLRHQHLIESVTSCDHFVTQRLRLSQRLMLS